MDFSVIVCTYNRAGNLSACLGALAAQEGIDRLAWEIVVVDNNSRDATRETVERLSHELPVTVRYAFEPAQGLNHARNRGITESKGKYFSFVDDDIIVSRRWLAGLRHVLETNDADAAGSCIHLNEEIKLPKWIAPEMYGFLGYQDYGTKSFQMDGMKQYPFGGNMSFNRRVVARIGMFNPNLGRKGEGRKRGELFKGAETDYFHRLAAAGGRIFYTPDAVVYHQILPFQLTKGYFRTIHFNAGYQRALYGGDAYSRNLLGIPLFLYRKLAENLWRYLVQLVSNGPDRAFRQQMTLAHFMGTMLGHSRRARRGGNKQVTNGSAGR